LGAAIQRRLRHLEQLTLYGPKMMAHSVVTAFTIFMIWWGVRVAGRSLVNLGIVGFAVSVGWFLLQRYFNKIGRSLGLIGLGILFLAGGWALEMMRRRFIKGFVRAGEPAMESQ
jgi:hypothetical protein